MSNWSRAGEYVPAAWVLGYRKWRVYDRMLYRLNRTDNGGITADSMETSQHTNFNENTTDESARMVCSNCTAVKAGHLERMKKDVLTPLR